MKKPIILIISISLFLLLNLLIIPAAATVHKKMEIAEIAKTADIIFVGTVTSQFCRYNAEKTMIFTDVVFESATVERGKRRSLQKDFKTIILTFAGGEIEGKIVELNGNPKFQIGERYLVFALDDGKAYMNPIVGGSQGLFRVVEDRITNKSHILNISDHALVGFQNGNLKFSKEKVLDIRNGIIIPDISGQPYPLFAMPPPNSTTESSSAQEASKDKEDTYLELSNLEDFIRFIKKVARKSQIDTDRLTLDESGYFIYNDDGIYIAVKLDDPRLEKKNPENKEGLKQPQDQTTTSQTKEVKILSPGGTLGACGYHNLHIVMEQVPSSWWSYDDNNLAMWIWNEFMDIYRYVADDGSFGDNSENEFCGWLNDSTLFSVYGFHWGTGIAGCFTQMGFLQPTCGRIDESDILLNSAYNWTDDSDYAVGNPDVILLLPVLMHELGHSWGYQRGTYTETYDYDYASVMHSYYHYLVENGVGIHLQDAYLVRVHYDDQTSVLDIRDIGVESYYAQNGLHNSTTNETYYYPGESIIFQNLTVENMSNSALSDVRIRMYLSTNNYISTSDYILGSYWYWTTFGQNSYSVFDLTTLIPEGIPSGWYYVGAIVSIDGFNNDDFTSNNSTYFYNRIYVREPLRISGYIRTTTGVGLSGVVMSGLPGSPSTDTNGYYSDTVMYGWSGTVTPSRAGYTFSPTSIPYSNVTSNQTSQNYTGTLLTYSISGYVRTSTGVGISGVEMSGLPGSPTTDASGNYTATVDHGWSGTVTPTLTGYAFSPTSRTYSNVTTNRTGEDYTAALLTYTISGQVTHGGSGLAGVVMSGLPGSPTTDASGNYTATVDHGWSGTVTPTLTGYAFSPPSRTYSNITTDQTGEDYSAIIIPVITVTSPNGGESWQAGTTHNITWIQTAMTGDVTIELYKGGTFNSPIGTISATAGTYPWTIPSGQELGNDYQVRIYQLGVAEDYSDNTFSITAPPQHTLAISATSGGTTSPVPGTYPYVSGTDVQVEAFPDTGYKFSHWSGDVPFAERNSNPITINMDSNKSITANFFPEREAKPMDRYRGVLAADVDNDGREELVVDYGTMGIYLYDPYSSPNWTRLYGINPDFMIAADSDGNNTAEIFAYFEGDNAIHKWEWVSGDADGQWSWNWMSGYKCDYMFPADIEDDGEEEIVLGLRTIDSSAYYVFLKDYNSGTPAMHMLYSGQCYSGWPVAFSSLDDEIVGYFQSMHMWDYQSGDPDWTDNWISLTNSDPDLGDVIPANFDGDTEEELVVDILNQLWAYNYSSSQKWSRLNAAMVIDMRSWPQVIGSDDELLISFVSPDGLWMYDAQASTKWQRLNGLTPDYDEGFLEIFNADGDTDWDIAVDFSNHGIGLWKYDYNGSPKWTSMNGNPAEYMLRADLDGDGDHELLVKFSAIAGLWKWDDDTTPKWQRINGADPD